MATLTTEERCPTSDGSPKGIIENKNSLGGSSFISNDVPSFASLYGFIREFRKPIKTLSFWSSDKHAVVSNEQVQAPGLAERGASKQALPQLETTSSTAIGSQNVEITSQLERSVLQTNSDAQVDDPLPPNASQQELREITLLSINTLSRPVPEQELNETPILESTYEEGSHKTPPSESPFPKLEAHLQHPVNTQGDPAGTVSLSLENVTTLFPVESPSSQQYEQALGRELQVGESDGSFSLPGGLGETHLLQEEMRKATFEARVRLGRVSQRTPVATSQDHAKNLFRDESRERICSARPAAPTLAGKATSNRLVDVQFGDRETGLLSIDQKRKGKVVHEEEALDITLPLGSQLERRANAMSPINVKGKGSLMAAEAPGVPLRAGPKRFEARGKDLFEATKLRPEKYLLTQWKNSGRQVIDKLLRDLHLGQNIVTNLRLSMLGSTPDENSMKPTILIVCSDEKKIKEIDNHLREFIKISFPDCIELKIIAGKVRLASGPGSRPSLKSHKKIQETHGVIALSENDLSTVGTRMTVIMRDMSSQEVQAAYMSSAATIGGIITVGDSIYGLTVAHSLFGRDDQIDVIESFQPCGWTEVYEWTGEDLEVASIWLDEHRSGSSEVPAMDWMLLRLREHFMRPNAYRAGEDELTPSVHDISGFVKHIDLPDDDVWVCSGYTQPQSGTLDSTPSSIIVDRVSYEVLSLALEYPLGMFSEISA
jgi:hypothetical protein